MSKYDVKLCDRLINLGISPRKSYENNSFVFDNIPKELKWHFIRGYFDGDGCINVNQKGQFYFEICSKNKMLLDSMLTFIKNEVDTSSSITVGDGVCRIRIGGNNKVSLIKRLLYNNSTIYLDRKLNVFSKVKEHKEPTNRYKGVLFSKKLNKYQCSIYSNNKKYYIGLFDTELEAVEAYNKEARKLGKKEQEIKWEYH